MLKNFVDLTKQTTRKTISDPRIDATPTENVMRLSSPGFALMGGSYDQVNSVEGQFVTVLKDEESNELYIALVPEGEGTGCKLAATTKGSNLTCSSKGIYTNLDGQPSSETEDENVTVSWNILPDGETIEDEDHPYNGYTFFLLEKGDTKSVPKRERKSEEAAEEELGQNDGTEVDFD